jgi:hypothetical protein
MVYLEGISALESSTLGKGHTRGSQLGLPDADHSLFVVVRFLDNDGQRQALSTKLLFMGSGAFSTS